MGNDGGSIPTRRELVKEGAKDLNTTQVKEIQSERQEHYWKTCALSHEPLVAPVVSDALGTLYNKSATLSHLLALSQDPVDKDVLSQKGEAFKDRIRSIKDVVDVNFESESTASGAAVSWICPITNKSLGPGTRSIYIVPCGHAFAESVTKEMQGDSCLKCGEVYSKDNIIPILPTSEAEKERLEHRLQTLQADGLTHSLKKATGSGKKRKKATEMEPNGKKTKEHDRTQSKTEAIGNAETASLTAKVLAEQEARKKRRKLDSNDNVKSLFSSRTGTDAHTGDFMTRGFTVPADAKR
ncbi:MAG: Replication termination factor 2 [Ramalina farinacea]|uniref:Replication termination factor 2 n=1 Tax=Ramalina farinacea TaxID=258253 RepID=A0AA43QHR7_9LECA|nr:Replication termination factor 2 [Ramalina farinacea]